jgi:hypothetical protein
VLPASLVERLTTEQWLTLLAHELAHWRRRDHWVRWLELAALGLYWWCPLAWWAKAQLQQAEEECCDAWVVWTLPGAARAYALALVETVEFLAGARPALPPAASGLGQVQSLKRRLTMILRGTTPRALSLAGIFAVLGLGALLLPLAPTWAQAATPLTLVQKEDPPKDETKKADPKPDPRAAAERLRDEFQKAQQDFMKLQQEMARQRREFEEKLNRDFAKAMQDHQKRMRELTERMQAGQPGTFTGFPPGGIFPPGATPGLPGAPPPPQPPGFFPPAGFPGGGAAPRPDLERRITEIERKLDELIRELRRDPGPQRKGPGAAPGGTNPGARPGAGGPPAPAQPAAPPIPPPPPPPPPVEGDIRP